MLHWMVTLRFLVDRMYEFTMNGPGPYAERVDWSWEDLGEYNAQVADTTWKRNT